MTKAYSIYLCYHFNETKNIASGSILTYKSTISLENLSNLNFSLGSSIYHHQVDDLNPKQIISLISTKSLQDLISLKTIDFNPIS